MTNTMKVSIKADVEKPCINCKFLKDTFFRKDHYCANVPKLVHIDYVNSQQTFEYPSCYDERKPLSILDKLLGRNKDRCGPEGKYFVAKETKTKPISDIQKNK